MIPGNVNTINKIKLLELKIPIGSTASEFYIPDQPDLRDVLLQNIVFVNTLSQVPKTYANQFTVNDPLFQVAFLTLYDMSGFKFVDSIPLIQFIPFTASGGNLWGNVFRGQRVNWTKCFIHIADISLISAVRDEYFQWSVLYTRIQDLPKKR
jgi:hypothetical protein